MRTTTELEPNDPSYSLDKDFLMTMSVLRNAIFDKFSIHESEQQSKIETCNTHRLVQHASESVPSNVRLE